MLTPGVITFWPGLQVDIVFASRKLEDLCNDAKTRQRELGTDRARRLARRLDDIRAAETLEVMRGLPGRCHELTADRAGQLSLDLDHPHRLVLEPVDHPAPQKPDGGLDWRAVRAIRIIGIEDTHG